MNVVDIAIGKSHTNSTVVGLGTIKGSPCVIKSTTKTATGNDVVFEWTSTTGTTETSTMKVKDGLNIIDVEVNSNNTITCTLSDGSTITSTNPIKVVNGKDGVNGNDGVSVTDIEVNVDNTITSTLSDGNKITSTNKITVKDGSDGKDGFSPSIVEDENNTNDVYKLKITTKESVFTTPNLKGKDGDGSSTIEISQETGNVLVEKSDGLYVPTTNVSKISAETDNQIKVKDDGIYVAPVDTSNFVEKEEGKELFSGKYEDLTGAPSIPSTDGLATETYVDTKIADLVNNAPETLNTLKEVADAIEHNESVVDALNESIGNKVDKVDGKGLSTNDFTDDVKESYDKAVTDSHTHDNKVALDSITSGKIAEWDNKSEFSGSYNDLTDVPTIPSADDIITQEELNAVLKDYAKETDIPITLPANGGDANTVNGHTVESDVPTDAKFTDTVYTHPTTSGNKHIPSGGSNGQILGWDSSGTASWKSNIIKASKTESDVTGKANSMGLLRKEKPREWTNEEIEILKENYNTYSSEVLIEKFFPDRNVCQLSKKKSELGLVVTNRFKDGKLYWTEDKLELLFNEYPYMNTEEFYNKYFKNDISLSGLYGKINHLGIKKDEEFVSGWTTDEDKYLKENYRNTDLSIADIAEYLGKDENSVQYRATNVFGIYRKDELFSEEERELIRELYPHYKTSEFIDKFPNRTIEQLERYARRMGVKKSKDYIRWVTLEGTKNSIETSKPQQIINDLLDEMGISYIGEYDCKYYLIDHYLTDYNLMIEVQGDFWHCSPLLSNKSNTSGIEGNKLKDKRKHSYIRNNYNIEVLYLWEKDINNNIELCKKLIEEYISSKGILENYHSFNYILNEQGNLKCIENKYVVGY